MLRSNTPPASAIITLRCTVIIQYAAIPIRLRFSSSTPRRLDQPDLKMPPAAIVHRKIDSNQGAAICSVLDAPTLLVTLTETALILAVKFVAVPVVPKVNGI